ncbi:DUF262 domain-containing protein [Sporosarcina sp. resist]|uniref:DUF262 domain-containing protein n=1 Tax=Sporosarcina sp. resist TaxID=2762563 RepID=UPI00164D6B36|nr:DUF262 domain-containing protein [Sporosarcina sp. resist]QNK89861.1 DUF262 domain-containing protein [Sporosarcina sp. resist]
MEAPTTFWQLLNHFYITIPIIQRDYAQGRMDDRTKDIRTVLLEHLQEALEGERHVDFDFVYGSVENQTLTPLDGQQRLTTLFLLHWYFSVKENIDIKDVLSRFSYETRISARDFCRALVLNSPSFSQVKSHKISDVLQEKKWFQHQWLQDPTVHAMLVMLDDIHTQYESLEIEVMLLLTEDVCPITFSFLELKEFGLGDELYIKMNARGKPLSTFENFKAQFEQVLEEGDFLQESKNFSKMLEREWTDLLWSYKSNDFTIDESFIEVFSFITTALVAKKKGVRNPRIFSEPFVKRSELKAVYDRKEHVSFLFETLSLWGNSDDIRAEFNQLTRALPLYTQHTQLFDMCVQKDSSFSLYERILLYTIVMKKLHKQDDDMVDTLRVIRNLVQRIRQANNGQFNSNLRFDMIGAIFRTIDQLIETNEPIYDAILRIASVEGFALTSWKQEQEKARLLKERPDLKEALHALEDELTLKGSVHRLLPIFKRYPNETLTYVKELLQLPDALVARAMLTIDDFAPQVGWSNLGPRYVFGGSFYRDFIWTNNNEDLTETFSQLIELLIAAPQEKVADKIAYIISNNNEWGKDSWVYYFVKYPTMLRGNKLLYVFADEEKYAIERLTGVNLQAEHINPFYDAVIQEINDNDICKYSQSTIRLSDPSCLVTEYGFVFRITEGYWTYEGESSICDALGKHNKTLTGLDLVERGVALVRYAHAMKTVPA